MHPLLTLYTNSDFQLRLTSTCSSSSASGDGPSSNPKSSVEEGLISPILTKISVILVKVFMNEYLTNAWASFFQDVWGIGNFDIFGGWGNFFHIPSETDFYLFSSGKYK